MDLANAHKDEGGALIPFKKRIAKPENTTFRNRQIMALRIPTYHGMKDVMFYDVLQKLCQQSVQIYFQKDIIKKMQRKLKVVKMLGADALNDDTLEAIHNKNTKQNQYDKDITELMGMVE